MAEFLREKRLRWFGHVQRRNKDDATRTIQIITDDSRWKSKSRQTKAEMARSGEGGYMVRNQIITEMSADRTHRHVILRAAGVATER